jgi:hypothetical protein
VYDFGDIAAGALINFWIDNVENPGPTSEYATRIVDLTVSVLDINSGWPGTEILKDSMTVGHLNNFTTVLYPSGTACTTCSIAFNPVDTTGGTAFDI